MPKLDSRLESEGAEFLVLGQLLIEGIPAYKAYSRLPGYDLVATWPEDNRSARIQVKSRWATDYDGGFLIKNFDFDFLVFVELNRGNRRKGADQKAGRLPPRFYVFPQSVAKTGIYEKSSWGKVFLRLITNASSYENSWHLIREFLNGMPETTVS